MNTFQKNALFLVVILFVVGAVSMGGYYKLQSNKKKLEEQKLAWKKQNIRDLKDLSQIGVLSTEEQTRLDNAGDDVDRLQQVLIDLHTERHTVWSARMQDIQEREQKLHSYSYLTNYDDNGQIGDAETELRKERVIAKENLDGYQSGYLKIRAWRPMTFDQFQSGNFNLPNQISEAPQESSGKLSAAKFSPEVQSSSNSQVVPVATQQALPSTADSLPTAAQNALDNVDVEISTALQKWSQAMLSNDPQQVANCYASHVDRYFLKLDIDNEAVKGYMHDWSDGGVKRITGFSTKEVTFENETADTVKLRLVKNMTISDTSGTTEHLIRSRLYLRREDGVWKITSEQDFK